MHRPASVDVVASLFAATATKAGLRFSSRCFALRLAGDNSHDGGMLPSASLALGATLVLELLNTRKKIHTHGE